jgi:hypothetical protein
MSDGCVAQLHGSSHLFKKPNTVEHATFAAITQDMVHGKFAENGCISFSQILNNPYAL